QAEIGSNAELEQAFKEDPVKAIKKVQENNPTIPNTLIYQIVVGSLGLSIILVIIGVVILQLIYGTTTEVPTIFTAIASGAIGALAGLLAPSPRNS
ncbi:MAG: hypothetical protein SGJ02_02310, partial [bacterium]|nr:hypothetical protein [bacterium]